MKEREEFDYLWLGTRHFGHTKAILTDAGPMRRAVNPGPIQEELISNDLYEFLVYHSLAAPDHNSAPLEMPITVEPGSHSLAGIADRVESLSRN